MFNWRKPSIYLLLRLSRSKIPYYIKETQRIATLPQREIQQYQERKLQALLLHAWQNVPYYKELLSDVKVVSGGKVNLANFDQVPILTKDTIRNNFDKLLSRDCHARRTFENRTGGSTGEPLLFVQERAYEEQNNSNKLFYCLLSGKHIGEREMKIWGSHRDIMQGTIGIEAKVKYFLYNRLFENSFNLTEDRITEIIMHINRYRPKLIWGYVNSLDILAHYINDNKVFVNSPHVVFSAAGTLHPHTRENIKKAFRAKVLNIYGSREMGDMAIEEEENKGLLVFQHSHFLELGPQRENLSQLKNIFVTFLNNYAMPFMRVPPPFREHFVNLSGRRGISLTE